MTIIEAINAVDNLKPNSYTQTDKVRWLGKIDGTIKTEIIDAHQDADEEPFSGYTEDDISKTLIAPPPYDELYLKWLEAQIDYANGEYGKYNNSKTAFNLLYGSFERYYNRTHKPKGRSFKYF